MQDRRRSEEQGTAYPLRDGRQGVGALIVFGAIGDLDAEVRERVMWLAVDGGERFAAAAAVRQAEERAATDPLTGLPNRTALDQAMANAPSGPCAVLYVDLDHFKAINDRLGHPAGDEALRHIAGVLRAALREGDVPARTGGEEFVLWLPNTTKSAALEVAERVRRSVEESGWRWQGSEEGLTCSIGVAAIPDTTQQVANLTAAADAALYRAKRAGRNRVEEARPAG
jgi:diguanylate cyclase (GGDEF)-like protein